MAPNEEELLRYALDDEPLKMSAEEHLAHCSLCRQRLATYKQINTFFVSNLYRSQCPTPTQLNHYCANLLSIEDTLLITDHLKMCPLCATEVLDIRKFLADFEPFPAPMSLSAPVASFKQILASLVPWQPQMVTRHMPTESQDAFWPRQYRAGTLNISLHLSRTSNGNIILLGLFSSTNPAESIDDLEGIVVELYRVRPSAIEANGLPMRQEELPQEMPFMCTSIDDLGNVVFKAVAPGEYRLVVHLLNSDLVIKGLTIAHS
jgi:hypothetical protein